MAKPSLFATIARAAEKPQSPKSAPPPRDAGRRGPKCLISYALMDEICKLIEEGASAHVAAQAIGIHSVTHAEWLRRGADPEEGDPIFGEYLEAVTKAKNKARSSVERRVAIDHPLAWLTRGPARVEDPDSPAWLTEKQTLEVTGKGGGPIAVAHAHRHLHSIGIDLRKVSEGDLDALEAIITRALPSPASGGARGDSSREGSEARGEGED